jgi:hypothetical protein
LDRGIADKGQAVTTPAEDDLRATAADLAADAHRLEEIERTKSGLELDDPRLADLSAESEQIARRMVPKAVAERDLVNEIAKPSRPRRRN